MLLAVVDVPLRKLRLVRQHVLADESPDRYPLDALRLEQTRPARQPALLRRVDEHLELDDARALDHGPPEGVDEVDRRAEGAAGGDQVVYDEDPVWFFGKMGRFLPSDQKYSMFIHLESRSIISLLTSLLDPVLLDRQPRPLPVLRVVLLGADRVRHLALLAHHDEGLLQCQGDLERCKVTAG